MPVELPIWIIKNEKNLFLCISEPSAFYRHFVRLIPVALLKETNTLSGSITLESLGSISKICLKFIYDSSQVRKCRVEVSD